MVTFKTGDIVQLKSGGPKMTVEEVEPYQLHCQWFAGSKLDDGWFPTDSVVKADDESKSDKKK